MSRISQPLNKLRLIVNLLISVKYHLEDMNRKAGALRYWSAVRYSSSLLCQMIDSISPYVTQILVSGKHVTVGTIGKY